MPTSHHQPPLTLAIDTSCDETAVAVVKGTEIWSNAIASQVELHRPYGGVFPTVAKLAHKENIAPTIRVALRRAGVFAHEIQLVKVTVGPGLAPALEVGIAAARAIAADHNIPLAAANHLEGHVLSVLARPRPRKLTHSKPRSSLSVQLPALAIIVSGGNTLFVKVDQLTTPLTDSVTNQRTVDQQIFDRQPQLKLDTPAGETNWQPQFNYTILGRTLDDAAGECLDKVGRMLNLGYPAGPVIEQFAKLGNPASHEFPLPLTQVKTYDTSFSGIKTHSRNLLEKLGGAESLSRQDIYDFCAGLQTAVFRHLMYKFERILSDHQGEFKEVWLGGGVAANVALRAAIRATLKQHAKQVVSSTLPLRVPFTKKLCGDNAAMMGIHLSLP